MQTALFQLKDNGSMSKILNEEKKAKRAHFAAYLKRERQKRGWSQVTLSKRAGIKQGSISNLENENKDVGYKLCNAIARAFDVAETLVQREAGLIPQSSILREVGVEVDEAHQLDATEALEILLQLSPEERRAFIDQWRTLLKHIKQNTISIKAEQSAN